MLLRQPVHLFYSYRVMAGLGVATLIYNLIFQLTGLGLLGVGIWARIQFSDYMNLSSHDYSTACYVLIGAGVIVTIIGFLGCCGALKEQGCMLKTVRKSLNIIVTIVSDIGNLV